MNDLSLDALVELVRTSGHSTFYRDYWGTETRLDRLKPMTREKVAQTPWNARRYSRQKSLLKIVPFSSRPFLSEWTLTDSALESYGGEGERPLVYLSNPHERLEKSLWCYAQGRVPVIGESVIDAGIRIALKCRIDSLLTDMAMLPRLGALFGALDAPLVSLSIIDTEFDYVRIESFARYARTTRLVLALPETGVIGASSIDTREQWHVPHGCHLDTAETIVISKPRLFSLPIIRYDTGISSRAFRFSR